MRDNRKSKEYFDRYLQYQYKRISAKEAKLSLCEEADVGKRSRINLSLIGMKIDMLIAEFSQGATRNRLLESFVSCCNTANELPSISYEMCLRLLSFGILLDKNNYASTLVKRLAPEYADDKLILCLLSFATDGTVLWSGSFVFPEIYATLDSVFSAKSEAECIASMKAYLDIWYCSNSNSAWYDSLDSEHDVYYGYWSFESAAIAKMLAIDINGLRENEYFPVI